ncbi:MAG: zinc ribbon domain-containing protein [Candidatus Helarchaeota archaeon]|nr:zinc ribbon domain-containing protein [Candidatus Helarchaeota archaeon]
MSVDKFKLIKAGILKRCKEIEDKHGPEKTTSFRWHQRKTVVKNFAFWKIAKRGIITIDDVKTAIYQLEKAGLIEIIDRNQMRLTPQGSQIASEVRTTRPEEVPDYLFKGLMTTSAEETKESICLNCGKQIDENSIFCVYCGTKAPNGSDFCSYCGTLIEHGSRFCLKCGKQS